MKRNRIAAALTLTASLALASAGVQAASTDLVADVVVFMDGGARGTLVLTGTVEETRSSTSSQGSVEDRLQDAEAAQVRVIIAPPGGLDLIDPIDLLDPRNLPDCGCVLVGDFGPFQDVPGSLPEHFVFHSAWMPVEPASSTDLPRIYGTRSAPTGSVSLSSWLLGDDGQPDG